MRALLRLAARLRGHLPAFVVVVLASGGALAATGAVAVLSIAMSTSLIEQRPAAAVALALVLGVVVVAASTWIEQWVAHVLAYRVIDTLRIELHRAIARLAPLGLARRSTGETVSRAIGDAETLEWFYAHTAAQVVAGTLVCAGYTAVAVVAAGPSGLLLVVAHLLIVVVPLVTARWAHRQGAALRRAVSDLGDLAYTARRFARETLLLGRRGALAREIAESTDRIQRVRRGTAVRLGAEQAASEIVAAALLLGIVATVVAATAEERIPAGAGPVVIVFVMGSTAGAAVIATAIARAGEVRAAAQRTDELLTTPGSRPDDTEADAGAQNTRVSGIRARALHVSYDGARSVLAGVDLEAEPGEIVAVAGASGSGKSTLLLALARLIPTGSGHVECGDQALSVATARRRVALVGQHAHVFRASVRDNLLAPGVDDAALWRALAAAQLAARVRAEHGGIDGMLSEAGVTWSGGERQRLGLARGLARDADILLLDEPTAGVDATTEAAFLTTLRDVARSRTVVVVTHREPVMRAADRVALLADGVIIGSGRFDELRERSEPFRRLLAIEGMIKASTSLAREG